MTLSLVPDAVGAEEAQAWTMLLRSARSAVVGDWRGARRQLESAPPEKRQAEVWASLALTALALGETARGRGELRKALAAEPTFAEARFWLGVTALRAGQINAALDAFDSAVSLAADHPEYRLGRALARAAAGRNEDAVDDILVAALAEPNLLTPSYHPDERRGLLRCLERGLEDYPDRQSVEDTIAHLLLDADLWFDAEVRTLKRRTAAAFEVKGRLALNRGELDEAIKLLEIAVSKQPRAANGLFHLARAAYRKGELDKARVTLRRAVELQPADPRFHTALGKLYLDRGDLERAELAYGYALAMKRTAPALAGLGRVLELQGDVDGAHRRYRQALALAPGEAEALERLARLLEGQGDTRQVKALRARLEAVERLDREFDDKVREVQRSALDFSESCELIGTEPEKALEAFARGGTGVKPATLSFARCAAALKMGDEQGARRQARAALGAISARRWAQGHRPAVVLRKRVGALKMLRYAPVSYVPAEDLQ